MRKLLPLWPRQGTATRLFGSITLFPIRLLACCSYAQEAWPSLFGRFLADMEVDTAQVSGPAPASAAPAGPAVAVAAAPLTRRAAATGSAASFPGFNHAFVLSYRAAFEDVFGGREGAHLAALGGGAAADPAAVQAGFAQIRRRLMAALSAASAAAGSYSMEALQPSGPRSLEHFSAWFRNYEAAQAEASARDALSGWGGGTAVVRSTIGGGGRWTRGSLMAAAAEAARVRWAGGRLCDASEHPSSYPGQQPHHVVRWDAAVLASLNCPVLSCPLRICSSVFSPHSSSRYRTQLLLPSMASATAAAALAGPPPLCPPQCANAAAASPLPPLAPTDGPATAAAVAVVGFGRTVTVFGSKQRPKLLTMYCRYGYPGQHTWLFLALRM